MVATNDDEFQFFRSLEGKLITVTDASRIEINGESLSTRQIQRLIQDGKMAGIRVGRHYITSRQAVRDYLNTERHPGPKGAM